VFIYYIHCVHMNVNRKMIHVEIIPETGGNNKGK
jgi:hypothetical protein